MSGVSVPECGRRHHGVAANKDDGPRTSGAAIERLPTEQGLSTLNDFSRAGAVAHERRSHFAISRVASLLELDRHFIF